MVVIDREVAGAAVATVITSAMSPTVPGVGQTYTVNDATGYPASQPFVVVIDRGTNAEEKVLISSRSGTTFTVGQRGYDDTVGQTHTSGESTHEHALDSTTIQLLINHVDGVEVAPHSGVLLDNTAHDVEARHQFGSGLAFGVPVTPTALTPDIAGAAGTGNNPAREDHVHNVPAASAATITGSNAEGTAASFARSDHNHAYGGTNTIPGAAIVNDSITATQIAALAIGSSELGADAVIAGKIAAGAISQAADIVDGIIPLTKMLSEASTDFSGSVTFTNPSGNFILGTGGVKYANYYQIGRIILYWVHFKLGTGGNISGATTPIEVNLPVAAAASHRGFAAARARQDTGTTVYSGTAAVGISASVVTDFATAGASATWDGDTPFNWTDNDAFDAVIVYETA